MKRIQRQRTKGWRMPPNTVYVGRPTRWGNPWPVIPGERSAVDAVKMYAATLNMIDDLDAFLAPLKGKDLACWCPANRVCHADVLLGALSVLR